MPAGTAITIEPGVYLPGRFGVRIEDIVVLHAAGCDDLTASPKELLML
jgi:Xaa-Pro aminopeptidase